MKSMALFFVSYLFDLTWAFHLTNIHRELSQINDRHESLFWRYIY
jgi:hypothetical protein